MLTADGCRSRRQRFLERLKPTTPVVLADPLHLRYFANYYSDAVSSSADFGALLVIRPDGGTTLYHDNKLPGVAAAFADEKKSLPWYTGQEPETGPRRMVLRAAVEANGGRVHDSLGDAACPSVFAITTDMRRRKDADEVSLLKTCMKASDAGHAWARANIKPGMTELAVYAGVAAECYKTLGHFTTVYGDFTVSPGAKKRGGPPTPHTLEAGEFFILDYSVIVQGYRSDFTNTLCVGGKPTDKQQELMDRSLKAIAAGAAELKAGVTCQTVYDAMRAAFGDMAEYFTTHGGHGLGISHPEPPYIVRHSTETLVAGDVVTLEPGLYVDGVGGLRIEHNYLITDTGSEQLSGHTIALV